MIRDWKALRGSEARLGTGSSWSRRSFARLVMGGALVVPGMTALWRSPADAASPAPLPQPTTIKYFTPSGEGSMDGSTWQDAMPLKWLQRSFPFGGPGTAFFIGFDEKQPKPQDLGATFARLQMSGAAGNPLQLQSGYIAPDGALRSIASDAQAVFSSGSDWTIASSLAKKAPRAWVALVKGASHIVISDFRIDGTGADGFFKFGGDATFEDVLFRNISARNVGRVIETTKTTALKNVTIENCEAIGIVRGFARFWEMSDSTLRNLVLDADNQNGGIRNPCQLISLVKGSNVTFENLTLRNAHNAPLPGDPPGKAYIQGDGIVCEKYTKDIVIKNCHASNMGDGGFDLKAAGVTMEDSSAQDCKFGARIWAQADNAIRRCNFKASKPVAHFTSGCVQASGRVQITDTVMEAGPGTVALHLHMIPKHDTPTVEMIGGAITLHDGASLAQGSGVLDLKNVAVNGETKTQRIELNGGSEEGAD
jgi:hypothetical protein